MNGLTNTVFLNDVWQNTWAGKDPFIEAQALQGKVYRSKEGRRTLQFTHAGNSYFLKLHEGIGWGEIVKNLVQLRLPVLGAASEYHACLRLKTLGVDTLTPVAFGQRGVNPAQQLSFLITEDLVNTISLEDVCKHWATQPPTLREKRAVIRKLATISKTLHDNGINHRDYYLCHFLRADNGKVFQQNDALYLIDLHRAQMRAAVPKRWRVKDLAGLFYSAFDVPLTRRDLLCFLSVYQRSWLRDVSDAQLQAVCHKAVALYHKDFNREPPAHIGQILKRI
jgi:heptose I phosphotransferase